MDTEIEATELRSLQRRAYGREGGLDAVDAARLRELESRRATQTAAPQHPEPLREPEAPAAADSARESASADQPQESGLGGDADAAPPPISEDASHRPAPGEALRQRMFDLWQVLRTQRWWRRPRVIVGGLILLFVMAFAAGAAIPREPTVALSASDAQMERRAAISAQYEDYDADSLMLVAENGQGTLWFATSAEGALLCAVLDNGATMQQQCLRPETATTDGMNLFLHADRPEEPSFYGNVLLTDEGLPLARIQEMGGFVEEPAIRLTDEEKRFTEALLAEGYDAEPQIVGYLDGQAIWTANLGRDGSVCLLYDNPLSEMLADCADRAGVIAVAPGQTTVASGAADDPRAPLSLRVIAPDTGEHVLIELFRTNGWQQHLTITRSSEAPETVWGPRLEERAPGR